MPEFNSAGQLVVLSASGVHMVLFGIREGRAASGIRCTQDTHSYENHDRPWR